MEAQTYRHPGEGKMPVMGPNVLVGYGPHPAQALVEAGKAVIDRALDIRGQMDALIDHLSSVRTSGVAVETVLAPLNLEPAFEQQIMALRAAEKALMVARVPELAQLSEKMEQARKHAEGGGSLSLHFATVLGPSGSDTSAAAAQGAPAPAPQPDAPAKPKGPLSLRSHKGGWWSINRGSLRVVDKFKATRQKAQQRLQELRAAEKTAA